MWGETNFANAFGQLKRENRANAAEILTRITGGRHLSFFSQGAIERAIGDIGAELHGQYVLTFTPRSAGTPHYRRIMVALRGRPTGSRSWLRGRQSP